MPDYAHYGEPYPALNGIVLSAAQHESLCGLTERFARVFEKASAALARDPAALERLGFPWLTRELLGSEAEQTAAEPIVLGRFDFLLDEAGAWQLLEYNADTPSGPRETVQVEAAIAEQLALERGATPTLRRSGPTHTQRVTQAVLEALGPTESPDERVLGIMTDAGYAEDLAQTLFLARLLEAPLRRHRIRVVFGDVDNLWLHRGRLHLLGHRLDALYRYYPFETLLGQRAFADLFEVVTRGKLRLLNGLRGLLAQNKGVMAWIWEQRESAALFSPAERSAIRHHLPPVRWISDLPADPRAAGLPSRVLKQVFGREGDEVYFGETMSDEDWARCRAWGSYVVQDRVRAAPLEMVVRTSAGPEVRQVWPVVGSFAARTRWAGYYTRAGGPITTGHAKFVGTFWEHGGAETTP
jgi:glutathionylspermidine synthase